RSQRDCGRIGDRVIEQGGRNQARRAAADPFLNRTSRVDEREGEILALAADHEVVPHLDDPGAATKAGGRGVDLTLDPEGRVGWRRERYRDGEHRRKDGRRGSRRERPSVVARVADVVERRMRERRIDRRRARMDVLEGENADLWVELGDSPDRRRAARRIRERATVL